MKNILMKNRNLDQKKKERRGGREGEEKREVGERGRKGGMDHMFLKV